MIKTGNIALGRILDVENEITFYRSLEDDLSISAIALREPNCGEIVVDGEKFPGRLLAVAHNEKTGDNFLRVYHHDAVVCLVPSHACADQQLPLPLVCCFLRFDVLYFHGFTVRDAGICFALLCSLLFSCSLYT